MASKAEELIAALRNQCLSRGCSGIKGLGVVFRKMDIDFSSRITIQEFKRGLQIYGLSVSDDDVRILFSAMDTDNSGGIDFSELMRELRPPMSESRKAVIKEAFTKLDVNGDGTLEVADLREVYSENAKMHPNFQSGKWTLDETLRNFLDALDTPGAQDGKVDQHEFAQFYYGVSATVDDDSYFDMMMRSCYSLPPRKQPAS